MGLVKDSWKKPDRILTGFGAFLAALAVLYFGREAIFDLTPIAKSALLVGASATFLLGSRFIGEREGRLALYFFSSVSYLTFLVYYILRMQPSSEIIFLLLAVSGGVFMLVGRRIENYSPEPDKLKKGIAAIVVLAAALTAADLAAPEPEYRMELVEEASMGEAPVDIGAVTVENRYLLPQVYSVNLDACDMEERVRVTPDTRSDTQGVIDGSSSLEIDYQLARFPREHNVSTQNFSIESVENCPDEPAEDTVYVTLRPELD